MNFTPMKKLGFAIALGSEILGAFALPTVIGYVLLTQAQASKFVAMGCVLIGAVLAFVRIVMAYKAWEREDRQKDQ